MCRCGAKKDSINLSEQQSVQGGREILQEERAKLSCSSSFTGGISQSSSRTSPASAQLWNYRIPLMILLNKTFLFFFLRTKCVTNKSGCWLGFLEGHSFQLLSCSREEITWLGAIFNPHGNWVLTPPHPSQASSYTHCCLQELIFLTAALHNSLLHAALVM